MSESASIQLPMVWPNLADTPVLLANAFAAQGGAHAGNGEPDPIVLIIGNATPPLTPGTPAEQEALLGAIGAIEARVIARIALTRGRIADLIGLLEGLAANMDSLHAASDPAVNQDDPQQEEGQ